MVHLLVSARLDGQQEPSDSCGDGCPAAAPERPRSTGGIKLTLGASGVAQSAGRRCVAAKRHGISLLLRLRIGRGA